MNNPYSNEMFDESIRMVTDPVSGIEVIYAPQRAARANAWSPETPLTELASCPFCPSHEEETPAELQRWTLKPQDPDWQVRAVPNMYPIVTMDSMPAGRHELIIETPDHTATWQTMSANHLGLAFSAVLERVHHLYLERSIRQVQVFKNVGNKAGASLSHPHVQLLGLDFLSHEQSRYLLREQAYQQEHGCRYETTLLAQSVCRVTENEWFVALCPPASRMPYETWIIPRQQLQLASVKMDMLQALASTTQEVLQRLERVAGRVSHNIIWDMPSRQEVQLLKKLVILPRLTTQAGLEWNTGLHINPVLPEIAATRLRSA